MLNLIKVPSGRVRTLLQEREVLVVSSSLAQGRDLRQALQEAGATVVGPYSDSVLVMRAVANRSICCAVIDLALADDCRRRFASALADKGTPMVFLREPGEASLGEYAGIAAYFDKPIDPTSLCHTISRRLACVS